jgi:uncharacterized protein (DUF4415 family)
VKDENTVKYTSDNLPRDNESDFDRVRSLSDNEIDRAASADPDAQPADKLLDSAEVVVPVTLDKETFDWFSRKGSLIDQTLSSALREYRKSHTTD